MPKMKNILITLAIALGAIWIAFNIPAIGNIVFPKNTSQPQ